MNSAAIEDEDYYLWLLFSAVYLLFKDQTQSALYKESVRTAL